MSIDFAGLSGETLHGVLQEPLDKVRAGELPTQSITIRALVPDLSSPLPCTVDGLADDPAFRERGARITARSLPPLAETLDELVELGRMQSARLTVRVHPCPPPFKLFILNGTDAFFGFYPVREHTATIASEKHTVYDLMGKDTVLFHQAASDDADAIGTQYVREAAAWFDSMWTTIAREPAA